MIPVLSALSAEIAELCQQYHVSRLDVFGSAARQHDFAEESDVDLLVEYEAGHHPPSLKDYLALRDALESLLSRKVDLIMASAVSNPYVRAGIERSRQNLHGA
ncbi:MAG: nucleotidyltransferase domain-containing protein [Pseudomonadota bacterium]|nr:nucleotidyltransferase domain-containing protein [Pseudomonadota bacterium]